MKLHIHPQVLYRVPRFPLDAKLEDCWEELKAAIAISSSEFYELIKDTSSSQIDQLPEASQYTIWKYFNRAKYRATPFADFAGVGLCPVKSGNQNSQLTIADEQLLHTFIDWPHKQDVLISSATIAEQDLKLFANSSYYVINDVIRYISFIDGQFQLSEISYYQTVIAILQACTEPVTYHHLIEHLNENGHHLDDPIEFLDQLIDLQLLITELHPNIIGEDYFERINQSQTQYDDPYILAERKLISGALSESTFKELHKLVPILQQLVPITENTSLQQFADKLGQRFGTEAVPLIKALDPEIGIGYNELTQAGAGDDFAAKFAAKKTQDQNKQKSKDPLKSALLSQITDVNNQCNKMIQLDQLPLKSSSNLPPLPNTFSVLCSVVDDLICIDSIGGVTANSLLGRFTHTGETFSQNCKELAKLEQDANPEVLFFDIAYIAENKADNVSRRKAIYPLQLSILNYDTSDAPLTLDDILVSAQGNALFLWSKKYNKRLIPRLSSAYNHTRSSLALFRFLCDLQRQDFQVNLSLSLENLLPEATYYPRLQFRNIVLAPAKWKIDISDVDITAIKDHMAHIGASQWFKSGITDQTLCFNQQSEADMLAFAQYLKKNKTILIEEAFVPANSIIKTSGGNPYYAQFVLSVTHNEEIYKGGFHDHSGKPDPGIQQIIPPGRDWLYWEIYCHQRRSDEILAGPIAAFLEQYQQYFHKWFFIRYNENGDHIRFRVQMKNTKDGYFLISSLTDLLNGYIESGVISELLLKTYKRETVRYGWNTMPDIESHFRNDSDFILSTIPDQLSDNHKYHLVIDLALAIQKTPLFGEEEFQFMVTKSSDTFNKEHNIETSDTKELNNAYKEYRSYYVPELSAEQQTLMQHFNKSLIDNLERFQPGKRRLLFAYLMHMHVNRLFSANQRAHEMIIYCFLLKEIKREKAMTTPKEVLT